MGKRKNNTISAKKQIELDLIYKPLIGKELEIVSSTNKNQIGLKGMILLETANLFHIEVAKNVVKKIFKKDIVILTEYDGLKVKIDCRLLANGLVARLKKLK